MIVYGMVQANLHFSENDINPLHHSVFITSPPVCCHLFVVGNCNCEPQWHG